MSRPPAGQPYNRLDLSLLPNLPPELVEGIQFVNWRVSFRGGKVTKPPVSAHTGHGAKSDDPETWAPLPVAIARYKADPKKELYGVGRVMVDEDDLVGIDWDHCLDQQGNIKSDHLAAKWVPRFDSYTEITPSGDGLRTYVRSKFKPAEKGGTKNTLKGTEMYRGGRYFTLSGERWPECSRKVETRENLVIELWNELKPEPKPQAASTRPAQPVTSLSDNEILERARNAKNGAKFQALWSGELGGKSQSEVDAGLCAMLWFSSGGDREAVRRLFGQSALGQRDKWRKRPDYQEKTLNHACRGEVYTPRDDRPAGGRESRPNGAEQQSAGAGPSQLTAPPEPPMPRDELDRLTEELLNESEKWLNRFVVMSKDQRLVCSFYSLHTWAFGAATTTPYMHVFSAEPEEGKSILLEVLESLVRNPIKVESISAAALGRIVGLERPTLLLDELDALMKADKEMAQGIRGLLNGGYRKRGCYLRLAAKGKSFKVEKSPTFCPKLLAGIGELWNTIESRSIPIEMRRMLPHETIEDFDYDDFENQITQMNGRRENWAKAAIPLLQTIKAEKVPGLKNRKMQICKPLLAIAQLAGPEWTETLRTALLALFKVARKQDESTGVTLLFDIRDIFVERRAVHIPSKELAAALCEIEGRLWAEWSKGKGLSANNLARLLKSYKIYPGVFRKDPKSTPRGYNKEDFEDAWERYCLPPPVSTATMQQPASTLNETPFSKCNTSPTVAVAKSAPDPHEHRSVAAVAVQKGGDRQNGTFGALNEAPEEDDSIAKTSGRRQNSVAANAESGSDSDDGGGVVI